jgi:hypothetical protein
MGKLTQHSAMINEDTIKNTIEKFFEFSKKCNAFTTPFWKDSLSKKRSIELCQTGKFLALLNNEDVKIKEFTESPDFIIDIDNKLFGLEHERIFNKKKTKAIQSINNLFDDAANEFQEKHPNTNILVNFWLQNDTLSFKKNEQKQIKDELIDFVFHTIKGANPTKPSFIRDTSFSKHSQVSFSFIPDINNIKKISEEIVKHAVSKKEKLIEKYISNSNIKNQWLLLVTGNSLPDSYNMTDLSFDFSMSKFEKIYLLEDAKGKIYEIK